MAFLFQLFQRFLAKKPVLLVFSIVYIRKRLHLMCRILGFLVQRYAQGEKELYSKENGFVGFLHGVHWKACTYARGSTSPLQSWQQHPQNTLVLGSLVDVLLLGCFSGELSCFDFYKFGLVSVCSQKVSVYLEGCVNLFKT